MRSRVVILAAASLVFAGAVAMAVPPTPVPPVNAAKVLGEGFPAKLSDYGFFFGPLAEMQPAPGVTVYRLNTPLWSDGADKLRFVSIPWGEAAKADGDGLLQFPVGSALIKTFAFTENGKRRLIETRVLLHRADGWLALPYLWNAEQTEATLALAGARVSVVTPAGEAIQYRVPNKNQCKECHGLDGAVVPIGPKARNLSHDWLVKFVSMNKLDSLPAVTAELPLWEDRSKVPVQAAARAYLDVNCAHCHRPGGTASNSGLDLRWEQDDPHAIGIGKRPVAAGRGSGNHEFDIVPGQPDASILAYRMGSLEGGVAMPELGKATRDEDGIAVIRTWIEGLGK